MVMAELEGLVVLAGPGGGGDAVLKLTMLAVGSDGDRGGVWEV